MTTRPTPIFAHEITVGMCIERYRALPGNVEGVITVTRLCHVIPGTVSIIGEHDDGSYFFYDCRSSMPWLMHSGEMLPGAAPLMTRFEVSS